MEKRGLWHDANPAPPWDFRKAKRKQMKAMEPLMNKSEARDQQY